MDAHVLAAGELALKGVGRTTGAEHYPGPAPLGVVERAADGLRSRVHVHKQHLRTAGNHEVSVCGGHPHLLVQAEDGLGHFPATVDVLRKALLYRERVGARVDEQVVDLVRKHRFHEQVGPLVDRDRGVGAAPVLLLAGSCLGHP